MKASLLSRFFALAVALVLLPMTAAAQDMPSDSSAAGMETATEMEMESPATDDPAAANGDARDAFTAAVEAAQAASAEATAESYTMAAEKYTEAAEIAKASGDSELEDRMGAVLENATKAYVDAGTAYSDADDFGNAAAQFELAAELAGQVENADLQAKTSFNAGTAYVKAEDYTRALALLDAAIEIAQDDLNYQYVRAVALRSSGDTEGSETAFAALAARADSLGDEEMAARVGDTVGKSYLIEANTALKADQYNDAVTALDKAAPFLGEDHSALNKLYASAYYKMGVSQVKAEQFSSAQRSLGRAVEYGRKAGLDSIVNGAQAQLDYVEQVQAQG